MSGKGSARRRENTALVEANWPFPDRKADQAYVEQTRQDNLANANRNTEQDAKDG